MPEETGNQTSEKDAVIKPSPLNGTPNGQLDDGTFLDMAENVFKPKDKKQDEAGDKEESEKKEGLFDKTQALTKKTTEEEPKAESETKSPQFDADSLPTVDLSTFESEDTQEEEQEISQDEPEPGGGS